jgi:Protein of unknown function (DUF2786)
MTSERQEIAAKVRALLAKTVDKGCTEQEALAAAAKAKELMDRYQVDLTETELEGDGFVKGATEFPERRKLNVQDLIGWDIADYCEVKAWKTGGEPPYLDERRRWRFVYFGLRSDVEFANWLLKGLEAFIWQKADEFGGSYFDKRNFAFGCAERITERLRAEIKARQEKPVRMASGRDLVVVKHAIVQREFDKLGLNLRSCSSKSYCSGGSEDARSAGYQTGDGALFGRPVSPSRGAARIRGTA